MQYATAAELSAGFIKNHMYNGTIIIDTYDLTVCGVVEPFSPYTYNSAFYIEGLAVWANVTKNDTWLEL